MSRVAERIVDEVLARLRGLPLQRARGPAERIVPFDVEVHDEPRPQSVTHLKAWRVR